MAKARVMSERRALVRLNNKPDPSALQASYTRQSLRPITPDDWSRVGLSLSLVAIFAVAIANQIHLGVYTDPLWLMELCRRLLEGQTAYVDFLENSPPFAILIYMPPVLASHFLGVNQDHAFVAYVAILALASLSASAWILRAAGQIALIGWLPALTATAALLVLPDYMYGQRDHIVLILALPWLACIGLRASGRDPSRGAATASGIVAGLIFAIRPHYALSFLLVVAFVGRRRGLRALASFGEVIFAVFSAVASVVASIVLFPDYFTKMAPLALDVYARDRVMIIPLFVNPAVVASALLGVALFTWRKKVRNQPLAAVLVAAAIGVLISYFIQGKWFAYHLYPGVALLLIAFAIAVQSEFSTVEAIIAAAVGAAASGALFISVDVNSASWFLRQGEFYLFIVIFAFCSAVLPPLGLGRKAVAAIGISCAFAAIAPAWTILHAEWTRKPPFLKEIKALGDHPKVAIIGPYGAIGFPVTDAVHGRWAMSFIAMMLTDAANRELGDKNPNEEDRAKLEKYRTVEYDRFVEDMTKNTPDILIVDELWAKSNFHDNELRSMIAGYNKVASRRIDNYYSHNQIFALFLRNSVRIDIKTVE
jgi:hypothetical protein